MSKKQRAMWLILTGLFIFTTLAGIGLIWASSRQDNTKVDNSNNQQQTNKKQLKGTQLSNWTPVAHVDSLQTTDTTVGTGAEVQPNSTVTVDYTGALASTGVIFESSLDSGQAATFPLNGVIKGWQEGLVGMKAGGTRRLVIPSSLAYGATGNGTIPPNSDLVFDVHVIAVK